MADLNQGFGKGDIQKDMSKASASRADGSVPADSTAAAKQHMDDSNISKEELIKQRQANLPLPEDPPTASDFNSADMRTTAVGSGGVSADFTQGKGDLRSPATTDSVDGTGRQAPGGGLPNDAVTREAKNKPGLADTTGKDYGYPHKSDPSNKQGL